MAGIGGLLLAGCFQPSDALALSCSEAAAVAETGTILPPGLLLAIGTVESGRVDATGKRAPWPWTINAAGTGHFFSTADEAILAVQSLRASGLQSVDIGCFQINLFHHPDAFADLASGFDPLTNARAAMQFLVSLHDEFGSWEPAIAAYHSRTDGLGAPYRALVLAVWHGAPVSVARLAAIHIWGPAGMHIWGPAGEIGPGGGQGSGPWRSRLPRIVTASESLNQEGWSPPP